MATGCVSGSRPARRCNGPRARCILPPGRDERDPGWIRDCWAGIRLPSVRSASHATPVAVGGYWIWDMWGHRGVGSRPKKRRLSNGGKTSGAPNAVGSAIRRCQRTMQARVARRNCGRSHKRSCRRGCRTPEIPFERESVPIVCALVPTFVRNGNIRCTDFARFFRAGSSDASSACVSVQCMSSLKRPNA